ncbi:phage baseplate assembly protein V [Aquimarina addita]|uniref:Phage baseplate assembly protein V n=1 Tax=Aquimarina addita TaxID=870485 RepID=A0ABP6UK08_9FLAO
MATLTTTYISIANTIISSFQSLKLEQKLSSHHHLELICRADVLERSSLELVGDSKDFLAETISISIKSQNAFQGYKELQFKGVVTKVKTVKGFHRTTGDLIVIEAKSMSVLSDDGHHNASFVDRNLSEILERTYQGYDTGKLETSFSPRETNTLHYSVQFEESNFSYTKRLAAISNNWFYYNGTQLVFGNPGTQETPLKYAVDLQELSIEIEPLPNNFNYFTHDYLSDELYEKRSREISNSSSGYHNLASNKSAVLYNKETKIYHNPYTDAELQQRFDREVTFHTQAIESKQVIATGISDNPGVNLGEIIKIEGYGSFRIIEVIHSNTEVGNYQNRFKAITADLEVYPLTDIKSYPKSTIEKAVVIDNHDPEGLGRVTVQFPWQKQIGETTPFIRVMTSHAGSGRGLYMIPEINDEVICQFENNNSERPYVSGSFFNGNKRPDRWGTKDNDLKVIKTKSGHTIELNDTKQSESITITDKKGNNIVIDTAGETISINALKDISINAGENIQISAGKNISISAGENFDTNAGKNVSLVAGGNMELNSAGNMIEKSDNRTDIIQKDFSRQSGISDEYANEVHLISAEENLTIQSSKSININSAEKSKLF